MLNAAWDMASLMQGEKAGFRAKLAPVPLYRSREGTAPWGQGGMTYFTHVTLSGVRGHWANEPGMKWVIVHELAHWWDQREGLRLSREMWSRGMWELAQCELPRAEVGVRLRVSDWLSERPEPKNMREDWADSVAAYVYHDYAASIRPDYGGPWLISPERWDYVGQHMNSQNPELYPWSGLESVFMPTTGSAANGM